MKRTIRGKVYDTKKAELCYFSDISSDFGAACVYMTESVWKTRDGEFFVCFDCEPKWHLFDAETRRSLKKKCKSITPITEYDVDLWLEEQDNIYMWYIATLGCNRSHNREKGNSAKAELPF